MSGGFVVSVVTQHRAARPEFVQYAELRSGIYCRSVLSWAATPPAGG
jgi:hypothetical protein